MTSRLISYRGFGSGLVSSGSAGPTWQDTLNTRLRLTGPSGQIHVLLLNVNTRRDNIAVKVYYESGDLQIPRGTAVADWGADHEDPIPDVDRGHIDIGQGRCDILVDDLRGIGLGSCLMSLIVCWAHRLPSVSVVPIQLSGSDASSESARQRRNRFWEKLGFSFDYQDGGEWGQSKAMLSHDLINPEFQLAEGWEIEEF